MKAKNNAVFTGVIVGKPKLRKTKFDSHYVFFDFQVIGAGEVVTIPCVCWNSDLTEYFASNVSDEEYLIITGHLSEYTKQHKLQFVLESFDYTEIPAHDKNGVNHVHLLCPIVSKSIKVYNDIEYAVLKLEITDNKYCFCITNTEEFVTRVKGLHLTTRLINMYWSDVSGELVNGKDGHNLVINSNYLTAIPEYDKEALKEMYFDYDPIYDAD